MSYFTQAYAAKLFFKLKPNEYIYKYNTWYITPEDDYTIKINKTDGMALDIYNTLVQEIKRIYPDEHGAIITKLGSESFLKGVIRFLKDLYRRA